MICATCNETIGPGPYLSEQGISHDGHHVECAPPWVRVPRLCLQITKATKVDYVLSQRQTREHACHWPGCKEQVPPAMWGCSAHWWRLPKDLKDRIWRAYSPGQEITMRPSETYIEAAEAVQRWIASHLRERMLKTHRWDGDACERCGYSSTELEAGDYSECKKDAGSRWPDAVREARTRDEARKAR